MNAHIDKKGDAVIEIPMNTDSQRQKWSDICPWHALPELLLDETGLIKDCSKYVEALFGYRRHELVWQHISCLFPQLSDYELIQRGRINPQLDFICHCGHIFMALDRQGGTSANELSIIKLEHNGLRTLRLIVRPSFKSNS